MFGSGVFTQIRPLWVGDLGTRPKNPKLDALGLKVANLYFLYFIVGSWQFKAVFISMQKF
jgi:hypothetical protein